jgi:hypothetical protein
MDIQAVTGAMAIAYYIAKYISKAEPKDIQEKTQASIQKINDMKLSNRDKMIKIASKLMTQREVSAQEAAFRLTHLYLRKSSRSTVFVPTFQPENRVRMLRKESLYDEEPQFCKNIIDRYMSRPNSVTDGGINLEDISLFEFASYYQATTKPTLLIPAAFNDDDLEEFGEDIATEISSTGPYKLLNNLGNIMRRNRACVIKCPNFNPISDHENYYYSLILLYYPFREENFISQFDSIEQAFRELQPQFRTHAHDCCINPQLAIEIDQALLRTTEFDFQEREELNLDANLDMDYVDEDDEPLLEEQIFPEPPRNLREEIEATKRMLNSDQLRAYEKIEDGVRNILHNDTEKPLRLIVNGEGGSGKTFLIKLAAKYIQNIFTKDSILLCAPTGKAAHAISGMTLHRTFCLPIEFDRVGRLHKLGGEKLHNFRRLYKNVKFIIIDEMSLTSYQTLRMVHMRICEIFDNDEPFGGKNVLLLGDLLQMKPPRGSYIFKKPDYWAAEVHLWRICDFIELRINERQTGQDALLGICRRLRIGEVTSDDIAILQTRVIDSSNSNYQTMIDEFADCIWAFPTIRLADQHNRKKSRELERRLLAQGKQVFTVNAQDTYGDGYHRGQLCDPSLIPTKESKTGGIVGTLLLGEGSRFMLRRNKDVASGKVNGATGTVIGFEWNYGRQQPAGGDLPTRVQVQFDHTDKSEWLQADNIEFLGKKNIKINRRMYALILAWGLNHHKLQGITTDKIVIDLGTKTFAKGMCYVALSRVKTLAGLAISSLDLNKLLTTQDVLDINGNVKRKGYSPCDLTALEELNRLRQQFPQPTDIT